MRLYRAAFNSYGTIAARFVERTASANSHTTNKIGAACNITMIFGINRTAGDFNVGRAAGSIPTDAATDSGAGAVTVGGDITAGDFHLTVSITAGADGRAVISQCGQHL